MWQRPFVNVFKLCGVDDGKDALKEGDVQNALDKVIGKKVVRIAGNVQAANFLQMPKVKGQTLGLTGRFLYLQMRVNPSKFFVVHLDVLGSDRNTTRISVSNIFKHDKATVKGGTAVQIPFQPSSKWYIACIDLAAALAEISQAKFVQLKSIQLCATMLARNAFTSDIKYAPSSLPREMMLVHTKDAESFFEMVWLPTEPLDAEEAADRPLRVPLQNVQPKPVPTGAHPTKDIRVIRHNGPVPAAAFRKHDDREPLAADFGAVGGDAEVKDLARQPIMELERIHGFSGEQIGLMKWSKATEEIFLASGATVVAMRSKTGEGQQRFLQGHTAHVCAMAMSNDGALLATAQEGHSAWIRLWDAHSGSCLNVLTAHDSNMTCMDISADGKYMGAVGLDAKGRQVIALWDISDVLRGQKARLVTKQISNYNIVCLKFSPFEEGKLISCGRDSIRFYRLKDNQLRGCSIQLGEVKAGSNSAVPKGEVSRNVFTDIAYEMGYGLTELDERHVFVSSVGGAVFQINYGTRTLECVYQLHNGAINSLIVSEGFCITGSDDKFLRVWPVDFSDFFLEAEHDAPVTAIGMSPDQLRVCVGTEKGAVGVLDIPSHGYQTLIRSHTDDVVCVAADPLRAEFTTVSADGTIRVWNDATGEQQFQFDAPGQVVTCLAYHPTDYVIACGFENGMVRVFSIDTTSLVQEHRQHKKAVQDIVFTADGDLLLSAGAEGNLCVYDVRQNYVPIKYLATSSPKSQITVAVSKDGNFLATLGPDANCVLVFDAGMLIPLTRIDSPSSGVSKIGFSPDSQQLLLTTTDRKLECYEPQTGRFLYQVAGIHRTDCEAFDVDKSGKFIVTGGHDTMIKVWQSPEKHLTGAPPSQSFIAHSEGIKALTFNKDFTRVISVGHGDAIYVWKWLGKFESTEAEEPLSLEEAMAKSPEKVEPLEPEAELSPLPLPAVHWTMTHSDELAASEADPECITTIGFNGGAHDNVVWSPQNGFFAYSSGNNVVIEDLETKAQDTLVMHTQPISTMAINSSATLLASGSGGLEAASGKAPVYIWDLTTKKCIQDLVHHKSGVQAMAFSDDDLFLVTIGAAPDSCIVAWQVRTGELTAISVTKSPIHSIAWRPLAAVPEFITVGEDSALHWLLTDGKLVNKMLPMPGGDQRKHFTSVCFRDFSTFFIGDSNGCVWIVEAGGDVTCSMCSSQIDGEVTALAAAENRLVVCSSNSEVALLMSGVGVDGSGEMYQAVTRTKIDGPISSLAMDRDAVEGLLGTSASTIWYCNLDNRWVIPMVSGHQSEVLSVSGASRSHCYSTSCIDGSLHIWQVNGQQTCKLMRFDADGHCTSSALAPLGDLCVGGYSSGTLRMFRLENAHASKAVSAHKAPICSTWFNEDGSKILTASVEGDISVYDVTTFTRVATSAKLAGKGRLDSVIVGPSGMCAGAWVDHCSVFLPPWEGEGDLQVVASHAVEAESLEDIEKDDGHGALIAFAAEKHASVVYISPYRPTSLYFFNFSTSQVTRMVTLAVPALSLAVSPDGNKVGLGMSDNSVLVMPYESGKAEGTKELKGHSEKPTALTFSPCSSKVLSSSAKQLMLWDASM